MSSIPNSPAGENEVKANRELKRSCVETPEGGFILRVVEIIVDEGKLVVDAPSEELVK